jgi:hypothetical protein
MLPKRKELPASQAWICFILLVGLAAYLILSLVMRVNDSIQDPQNIENLDRAALQLFMPYLGIAVGGLFGTGHLVNVKPDPYRFWIAAVTLIIWDLLVVGYVVLILINRQKVEDFLGWSNTTLPVLSTLVAAIMAYYFGAQTGETAEKSTGESQAAQGAP